jgi:hypothetical protein
MPDYNDKTDEQIGKIFGDIVQALNDRGAESWETALNTLDAGAIEEAISHMEEYVSTLEENEDEGSDDS